MNRRRILLSYLANSFSWELYSKTYFYNELVPTTINSKNVLNKAKIVKVSGNGVIENQLVQNGNFDDVSIWNAGSATYSVSNNIATITPTAIHSNFRQTITITNGHKYLYSFDIKYTNGEQYYINVGGIQTSNTGNGAWEHKVGIITPTNSNNAFNIYDYDSNIRSTWQLKNVILIDLTLREGTGNEPTTLTDNRIQNILNRGYIPFNLGKYKESDIGVVSSTSKNVFSFDAEKYGEQNITISGTANDMVFTSTGDYGRVGYKVSGLQSGKTYSVNATIVKSGTTRSNIQVNQTLAWGGTLFFNTTVNGTHQVSGTFVAESDTVYFGFYVSVGQFGNDVLEVKDFIIQDNSITDKSYTPHKTFTPITFKAQLGGAINSHNTMEITNSAYVFTRNEWKYTFNGNEVWQDWDGSGYSLTTVISGMKSYESSELANAVWTLGTTIKAGSRSPSLPEYTICVNPQGRLFVMTTKSATQLNSALAGKTIYFEYATPQVISIPKKHLGIVDLGSLDWTINNGTIGYVVAQLSNIKLSNSYTQGIYCDNYISFSNYSEFTNGNKGIFKYENQDTIRIKDSSFIGKTINEIKALLSGKYLYYETENEVADIENVVDIESGGTITTDSEVLPNIELSVKCK